MDAMTAYIISTAVAGEINAPALGTVPYEFDAGTVTPKDETEAVVLELLAVNGVVEIAADKAAKPSKSAKPEPISSAKE